MPDHSQKDHNSPMLSSVGSNTVSSEQAVLRLMQIAGGQQQYTPTAAQVDKLLQLQEKGMDYTHDERTRYLPANVFRFAAFVIIIFFVFGIFIFAAFYAKDYLGEVISGVFGIIAGAVGGYGYGSRRIPKKNDE